MTKREKALIRMFSHSQCALLPIPHEEIEEKGYFDCDMYAFYGANPPLRNTKYGQVELGEYHNAGGTGKFPLAHWHSPSRTANPSPDKAADKLFVLPQDFKVPSKTLTGKEARELFPRGRFEDDDVIEFYLPHSPMEIVELSIELFAKVTDCVPFDPNWVEVCREA